MRVLTLLLAICFITGCKHISSHIKAVESGQNANEQVEAAESKMFNAIKNNDESFWKDDVSDSYVSINADGVMAFKEATIKDSARRKMVSGVETKLFDKKIRVFDNVGITTGRAQFFAQSNMVAEILYTAIFRKNDNKWLFESWQGTMSKNQPPPPPPPTTNRQ